MYHSTLTRGFAALLILSAAINSHASLTPVLPSPGGEPSLIGTGGILDHRFGLENLARIDDNIDQYWRNDGHIAVKTLAKWAGFRQSFGYIDTTGNFTSLLHVRNKWSRPEVSFKSESSGNLFRFGLNPGGAPLWSSALSGNSDGLDHMVTWQITDNRNKHLIGAYVIAWEDLSGVDDRDYNDLVLLVKGDVSLRKDNVSLQAVPVPAALWLFASGLFGLATVLRRRSPLPINSCPSRACRNPCRRTTVRLYSHLKVAIAATFAIDYRHCSFEALLAPNHPEELPWNRNSSATMYNPNCRNPNIA